MTVYVVGVDGSQTAKKAAQRAGELARATGGSVHVVSAFTRDGALTGADGGRHTTSSLTRAEQIAEAQAAAYRAAGLTATAAAVEGKAADVILDEAREVGADIIVVGN